MKWLLVHKIKLKRLHSRLLSRVLHPTQFAPFWIPSYSQWESYLLGMPAALLLWGPCSHHTCCHSVLLGSFSFAELTLSPVLSPGPMSYGRPLSPLEPFRHHLLCWIPVSVIWLLADVFLPSVFTCRFSLSKEIWTSCSLGTSWTIS